MERRDYRSLAVCIFLIVAVVSVYVQVRGFQFIRHDDDLYIYQNPHVVTGITGDNIRWAFRLSAEDGRTYWHPLTWMSHMLDVQLFGLNAGAQHLVNVLFHTINALLLFLFFSRATGDVLKSAFVASLFALHPVNVDSVAWLAERKNLLSTTFWLLTMHAYYSYTRRISVLGYLAVPACFLLGLLSKPMLITLPFVLLLLDYWPLSRIGFPMTPDQERLLREKLPFGRELSPYLWVVLEKVPLFFMAAGSIILSSISLERTNNIISLQAVPMGLRISNAIVSCASYIWKMIFPLDLIFFYPYPQSVPLWQTAAVFIAILLASVLALKYYRKYPYLIVGWLWFLGTLAPVSGIVQGGLWPRIAERWAYIPFIGLFIIVSWGVSELPVHRKGLRYTVTAAAGIIIMLCALRTFDQLRYWKDNQTLCEHALRVDPDNYAAHGNISVDLFEKGDVDGAISHCLAAIKSKPGDLLSRDNYGKCLFKKKEYDAALVQFNECLRIRPGYFGAYKYIGGIMFARGDYAAAVRNFEESLKTNPDQPEVYINLGKAFYHLNNFRKSAECFEVAVRQDPSRREQVMGNLMMAKRAQANSASLVSSMESAINAQPQNPELHARLGDIYRQQGENSRAIECYQNALSIKPGFLQAMNGLVLVYSSEQEFAKAAETLQEMRKIQPGNPDISYNLACVYAKQNMSDESVTWLKDAVAKGFRNLDLIGQDPDLANIRDTAFVRSLMKDGQ